MKKVFWISIGVYSAIFIAVIMVLTPYDLEITTNLFNKGLWWNKVLEVIGPAFMPFFMIYATVSLAMNVKSDSKAKRIWIYIGLGFSYIYATFMGATTFKHSYASWMFVPSIVLYILFTILMVYLNTKVFVIFTKQHIKICLVMLIVVLTSLIFTDIIKLIFSRVRFFEISESKPYNDWYVLTGRFQLDSSFPSGHVTRSGTSLCFGLLLLYKSHKQYLIYLVEGICLLFTIAVGVSRLYEGMHFVCDIIAGFFLITLSYYLSKKLLFK